MNEKETTSDQKVKRGTNHIRCLAIWLTCSNEKLIKKAEVGLYHYELTFKNKHSGHIPKLTIIDDRLTIELVNENPVSL